MSKAKPVRLAGFFTEPEAGRVRAAVAAAGATVGYVSEADLIAAAVMREVRRLERKHNNGKPWDPLPAGTARRGRRTKEELAERARIRDS